MRLLEFKNSKETFPIAIVVSRFNLEVTSKLLDGALARLKERGFEDSQITVACVPGAVEIPIAAQKLVRAGAGAVIALGAVIRGETTHYDYVCSQASDGCLRVSLDTGVPVIFGVLTTENEEQAFDRVGGNHGHKGVDAVDVAVEMYSLSKALAT